MPAALPVIIDTDPGIDDVVALALAARSPELEILAVTTTYGNATLADTTRNAATLLHLVGRPEIAVRPGSDRPLTRPLVTAPETHGPSGVGYAEVPATTAVASNPHVLLEVLAEIGTPAVLITLGPLTNLAHALASDPELVHRSVARHIGMFGNIHERGNTNRWADFNAWCDPEAADRVIHDPLETAMVGLDVTRKMTFSAPEVGRFVRSGDPLIAWLGRALEFYVEFHRNQERLDGCVVNDVLPIGELIVPHLLTLAELPLVIDLGDDEHRGHTREHSGGTQTRVALEVDTARMRSLLARVFGQSDEVRAGG
jgi:inosine-uridine nucleoside N-ribohydrolase